ncbi:unnamed protein product [Schistosoma margrebowiei]|uniref:Uncharacterized protein n=1 Tax=Schistosoma margrebowiei TaxID=48269 RepID=A0A183N462_9TREM|nr:unnamed protein product [Schistosoma margrebowiei]
MMQFDDVDFADDPTLLPHMQQQMQEKTIRVAECSAVHAIILDGEAMVDVKPLTYQGSITGEHGESDADVDVGICKARATYLQMKNI